MHVGVVLLDLSLVSIYLKQVIYESICFAEEVV